MIIKNAYTSIACNRTPQSADWGINDLILFAAGNNVAVFNPKVKIFQLTQKSKSRIFSFLVPQFQ